MREERSLKELRAAARRYHRAGNLFFEMEVLRKIERLEREEHRKAFEWNEAREAARAMRRI